MASAGPRFFGFVIGGAAAGIGGRRLADGGVGPERRPPCRVTGRRRGRAGRRGVGARPPRAAGDRELRPDRGAGLANVVALAAARHAVLERVGWDVEARGLFGRAGDPRPHRRRGACDARDRPCSTSGSGASGSFGCRPTARDGCDADALCRVRLGGRRRPDDRLHPGREREHRRVRPATGDRGPPGRPPERVAPRGRGVRALGCRLAAVPPPRRGRRAGRLVGDRRAQVAERRL